MSKGIVVCICIGPKAGEPMQQHIAARAVAGAGLEGDRYGRGDGSFNKGNLGKRQVSLMNALFFPGTGFTYADSRRNIFTSGVELMWLIGREFKIGEARMLGVKYCEPCERPSKLKGVTTSFAEVFHDRGGIIAEVLEGGVIRIDDEVIPPPKHY